MNTEALFLFLILLLGLVLCSFLGGNCGKEGYSNSNSSLTNGTTFYGMDGDTATISTNSNGLQTISLNQTGSNTPTVFTQSAPNSTTYSGPMGFSATVLNTSQGTTIQFNLPNGTTQTFTQSTTTNNNNNNSNSGSSMSNLYDNYNHYSGSSSPITNGTTFYGMDGDTATISTNSNGQQTINLNQTGSNTPTTFTQSAQNSNLFNGPMGFSAIIVTTNQGPTIQFNLPNGTTQVFTQTPNTNTNSSTVTSSQYFGSTGTPIQASPYHYAYQQGQGQGQGQGTYGQGTYGQGTYSQSTPYSSNSYTSTPYSSTSNNSSNVYANSLPQGIPASQIPPGQEDLYILKSEVVPPVCPACPTSAACPRQEKCPPCPACARCPEPSFECKKVPNYNAINDKYLPEPVLNDFSQFGM
jgi:hypothetical protein